MSTKHPSMKVLGVIPARFASTRLPGKMLKDVAGKPLIVRTWEAAKKADILDDVLVAADDQRIVDAIRTAGGRAVMTDPNLPSGSDRIFVAAKKLDVDIIVNVQGDEPLIPVEVIEKTVRLMLEHEEFDVTTAATPLEENELEDPNAVKVVTNRYQQALYFSRATIPFPREGKAIQIPGRKHVGIYAYRKPVLEAFCALTPSPLEECERLEQLRLLENGFTIGVADVQCRLVGVDTPEDLEKVRQRFA